MATLPGRTATALLVVDVQNAVVDGAHRRDEVVGAIGSLAARARRDGVPVIWVRHSDDELAHGTDGWQIVPDLRPADGEPIVDKHWGDAFEATNVEALLEQRCVGRLVVTGAETDACIRSTLHGAFTRGYDVTLVADAHTAGDKTAWGAPPVADVIAHTNLYWSFQAAPGRTAATVSAADVRFA